MKTRREFLEMAGLAGAGALAGCSTLTAPDDGAYGVAILGDTHYDAEPESVYHAHYDETNKWAKVQHAEFRRNGEMWRERCPRLLRASASLAHAKPTDLILQLGDIIQGDCDHVETHKKMLDNCIKMLRTPYPKGVPFLSVVGNHDFRGKGAWDAYFQFMEPFLSRELGVEVHYPAFSFRHGKDRWVFCNFESSKMDLIARLVDEDTTARHVFLVTHGPFTCPDGTSPRWRLGGGVKCEPRRKALYEALSRRHAVVLSGHTHTIAYYRHENALGGFSEFTCNSVWKDEKLATAEPIREGAAQYGTYWLPHETGEKREDLQHELDWFRPGLKDYFYNQGAGHFRLNASDGGVELAFYPGDALVAARTFKLK